ncbi:hypothetical protein CON99_11065 [Bacillus pseudomycoides]|nr:hypothetical protein CON79_19450 [Bacillus pseudomycoides]PEA83501.1 hypothetical protein CON99_11065 [Bacillus pseudomycoides]PGD39242.1 hypothetical protein COM30_00555 [Bacillus pseudomycoides]
MKTKEVLHSFSPSVFTWHGAEKGTDRFYPWSYSLSRLKRKVLFHFFNLHLYIHFNFLAYKSRL